MNPASHATEDLWIFGYGSLIWRPDFDFVERRDGFIRGYARRFWQGSTDHRGSVDLPGRVVTLIEQPGATCWGTAFRIHPSKAESVLEGLDRRESGGFRREPVEVCVPAQEAGAPVFSAQLYLAPAENPNFLGPEPLASIAARIGLAHGPSGSNVEYLLELASALREMGAEDDHVFALEALVRGGENPIEPD